MDRLQAGDFKAYSQLQSLASNEGLVDVVPRTDEGELDQLKALYGHYQYGETQFDSGLVIDPLEELKEFLPEVR